MSLIFAIPKGRIAEEVNPMLEAVGLKPAPDYFDKSSRSLQFATERDDISIIRARSFDVATFTAFGGAHFGVAGSETPPATTRRINGGR